jgi:hypothetical protein
MIASSIKQGFEAVSAAIGASWQRVAETVTQHPILIIAILVSNQLASIGIN